MICQKKGWRKGKSSIFTGDLPSWVSKISSQNKNILDRIFAAKQRNIDIIYHPSCYLSSCYDSIKKSQTLSTPSDVSDLLSNGKFHGNVEHSPSHKSDQELVKDAAKVILTEIVELKKNLANQPLEVSKNNAGEFVPEFLTLLLTSIIGCERSNMITSIGQDIVYAATSLRTPKHLAMAMTIRQLTGSRKLVTIMNKFGHSCTYTDSLRTESQIASSIQSTFQQLGVYIPPSIKPGKLCSVLQIILISKNPRGTGRAPLMVLTW